MKLFSRLAAMLLTCILLLSLGMTAASADTCYEMLKYTFSVEENGDFAWLGQGTLVPGEEPKDPEQDNVFFYVSFNTGNASVIGRNAEGMPETCMWLEAQPADMLLATIQVAASYEELSQNLDQCQQLIIVLETTTETPPVYIASAEDAQSYIELMQQAMEDFGTEAE